MSSIDNDNLCDIIPGLYFRGENGPFFIGKGWKNLIHHAFIAAREALYEAGISPEEVYITDIKEKYGGLRVSLGPMQEDTYNIVIPIIEAAEEESYTVCEVCGEEGSLRNTGWLVTRCDKHT